MSENNQSSIEDKQAAPTPKLSAAEIESMMDAEYGKAAGPRGSRLLGSRAMFGVPPVPLPRPLEEQGAHGTAIYGGSIQVKDRHSSWIGPEKYRTAAEIVTNISVVAAGVHYFLNLIAHPRWFAQPNSRERHSHEAKEAADFVNEVMDEMYNPWSSIVRHAAMYRFHGFSLLEWIAKKRDDGFFGLENIEVRPQHTVELWAVDDHGHVFGVFQRNPQTQELLGLPREKLLYIVEDAITDSPEGLGVFRHLAEPYARLKRFQELEIRGYERDLRGIPIGRAPISFINQAVADGAITKEEATKLVQTITDIIQMQVKESNTGILLDSARYTSTTQGGPAISAEKMWDLELLSGSTGGLQEIANAIERIQREIARIIGVEHLLLGDQGGSRAVAQDKSRNVYLIASSVLRLIVACVQRDVIRPLWKLNGLDPRIMPKLMAEDIAPRDALEVTTALARMAQAGAVLTPDDPAINDVRDLLGITRSPIESEPILSDAIPLPIEGEETKPLPRNDGRPDMPNRDERMGSFDDEFQRLPRASALMRDPGERGL